MDPYKEMRDQKTLYNRIHGVADSMEGIPIRCVCGGGIYKERAPAEVYDYLPGKRFFTCKKYKDDGLHYRQPWVCAVEDEIEMIKKQMEEVEQLRGKVAMLEFQNLKMLEEVEKLIARVSELEATA